MFFCTSYYHEKSEATRLSILQKAFELIYEKGFKKAYNGGAWIDLQKSLEK